MLVSRRMSPLMAPDGGGGAAIATPPAVQTPVVPPAPVPVTPPAPVPTPAPRVANPFLESPNEPSFSEFLKGLNGGQPPVDPAATPATPPVAVATTPVLEQPPTPVVPEPLPTLDSPNDLSKQRMQRISEMLASGDGLQVAMATRMLNEMQAGGIGTAPPAAVQPQTTPTQPPVAPEEAKKIAVEKSVRELLRNELRVPRLDPVTGQGIIENGQLAYDYPFEMDTPLEAMDPFHRLFIVDRVQNTLFRTSIEERQKAEHEERLRQQQEADNAAIRQDCHEFIFKHAPELTFENPKAPGERATDRQVFNQFVEFFDEAIESAHTSGNMKYWQEQRIPADRVQMYLLQQAKTKTLDFFQRAGSIARRLSPGAPATPAPVPPGNSPAVPPVPVSSQTPPGQPQFQVPSPSPAPPSTGPSTQPGAFTPPLPGQTPAAVSGPVPDALRHMRAENVPFGEFIKHAGMGQAPTPATK